MSYKKTNRTTIQNAFKNFTFRAESYIRQGMVDMAKAGLDYLIEAHEMYERSLGVTEDGRKGYEHHLHEQNTMAYAVAHNGKIIEAASWNGDGNDLPGEALAMAQQIVSATTGWVAIILSEMGDWYMLEKEQDYQRYSRFQIIQHFHDYFKPITQ